MNFKQILYFTLILLISSCASNSSTDSAKAVNGETMGTTYNIKYYSDKTVDKGGVDSLLKAYNQSVSTYIPSSTISKFNKADSLLIADPYLLDTYYQGVIVSERTRGAFDATVMPLVNFWGFGYKERTAIDSTKIDSIMQYIGFHNIDAEGATLFKRHPKAQLDLSAVAKGFGVDIVCNYLNNKGVENYMVEIGGEVRTAGIKPNDKSWILGIDKPSESLETRALEAKIKLDNKAMATSGNYRNFYMINGKKVAHTINPKTGYPEFNELLSASVITNYCSIADAYATAFMVMGFEKSREFLINNKDVELEVIFIYANKNNEPTIWKTSNIELLD